MIEGIRSEERHRVVNEWAWPRDYFRVCGRGHAPSPVYICGRAHTPAAKVSAVKSRKKTCVSVIALHLILCPS